MKKTLILGGGGFIGGHLAKKLKENGYYVRVCDIKEHEYFSKDEFCDEIILGDLRDPLIVSQVMFAPGQTSLDDNENSFDEVYQLAADMGGAGYIFTGDNDANVMHNSALINLNVVHYATKFNVKKVFYSSSACMYPEHNHSIMYSDHTVLGIMGKKSLPQLCVERHLKQMMGESLKFGGTELKLVHSYILMNV